jgi:nickel-dependent lactate racemase
MPLIKIPFDQHEIEINIESRNLMGILEPKYKAALSNPQEKIREVLMKPINSRPLAESVGGKRKACIVVTDITRPCPDDLLLPLIIDELEKGGIERENITVLVATGLHRANTQEELLLKLGKDICRGSRSLIMWLPTDRA